MQIRASGRQLEERERTGDYVQIREVRRQLEAFHYAMNRRRLTGRVNCVRERED